MQINILLNMSGVLLKRGAFNFAWPFPNDLPPFTTNSKTKLKCLRYQTKNVAGDGMWYPYKRPKCVCVCVGEGGELLEVRRSHNSLDHVTQNA